MKRSSTDRLIAGVCGGIADSLDMNANVLRVLVFIVLFTPLALPIIFLYFVLAFLLPAEPKPAPKRKRATFYYRDANTNRRGKRSNIREAEHVEDD